MSRERNLLRRIYAELKVLGVDNHLLREAQQVLAEEPVPDELEAAKRIIAHRGRWRHKNGNSYRFMYIGNFHAAEDKRAEYPLMVVYGDSLGRIWIKSPTEFLRSRTEIQEENIT